MSTFAHMTLSEIGIQTLVFLAGACVGALVFAPILGARRAKARD